MHRSLRLLPLIALTAAPLLAQLPDAAFTRPLPIHSQPDDPAGGAYGLWTAAADWKASFDGGFTFYPWIPEARTTRGWQWRTTSVRCGEVELLGARAVARHDAQRYEVERGGVLERYDVRQEGIEQSFRIEQRPAGGGELVVEGAITTPFTAAPVQARHGGLLFFAEGAPAMNYGAAFAIDANGRRSDVATSFDGERVRLHVDAAFVATAAFPLTIDPLTTNAAVRTSTQPILDTTCCCASVQGIQRVYFAVVREFSATDRDAYGFISNDNPSSFLDVFSDVTTSWSTNTVDLAEVGGASSWALAIEREFSGPSFGARVYVQGYAAAVNTGTTLFLPTGTTKPAIGGNILAGTAALVVYGQNGDCMQTIVDCTVPSLGTAQLHQTNSTDWAVTSLNAPGSRWCVVTRTGATPALRVRLVDEIGSLYTSHLVPNTTNATGPAIDGLGSRFLLTWGSTVGTPITINRVNALRFDLLVGQNPVYQTVRTLASAPVLTSFGRRDMAYDWGTQSHWVVGFHSRSALSTTPSGRLLRLGHSGAIVESVDCNAVQGAPTELPCAAHSGVLNTGSHFQAGYAAPGTSTSLVHRRFDYSPAAGVTFYGTSCRNVTMGDGHPPYAGSQFYSSSVFTQVPNTFAIQVIGFGPVSTPLAPYGMGSCMLLADPVITNGVVADGAGLATMVYSLPDDPLFLGDLYGQWFWIENGSNPLNIVSGGGLVIHVQ